ncbi:arsenite methyltransferase isoform X3 [Poecilia reticulata]|uniref:arsenite methyltransferase isoform X3 n=1 Tax=Poecilia reticulata TaxID=8081 RepID=UPI0004A39522|nr:PREDICTED: arsenite methyltransferase isoform X3 [Poecilia reticulata]
MAHHNSSVHEDVKDYYGKRLQKTSDLKTGACVAPAQPLPAFIREALKKVHPEVSNKYYGCGLVVPESLEGCRILDLGCGSGRDCYMLSLLVGEKGHVTGIDMTEAQLEVARKYMDYHAKEFGYKKPNDGGELYFSDIYSSGRLTEGIKNHKVLWGECLGGALWWKDLLQLAEEVGFSQPRLVTATVVAVDNKELQDVLGDFKFVSATYRLFKVPKGKTKTCQVIYNGGITGAENIFQFDCHYTFKTNEVVQVDGEAACILTHSRFAEDFTFQPPGGSSEPCCAKPKTDTVDPFNLASQSGTRGGCCSTKSADCCK